MVVVLISANGFILPLKLNLSNCGPTVPVAQKSSILYTAPVGSYMDPTHMKELSACFGSTYTHERVTVFLKILICQFPESQLCPDHQMTMK